MPHKDPEKAAAYAKAYRQANRKKAYERVKEWRAANPERWKEQQKKYAQKHPEKIVAKTLRWIRNNPERAAMLAKASRQRNKDRISANKAKYRADKRNRTPKWVDADHLWMIKEVYDLAIKRTKLHGFEWHVDHIIPLNGKIVSGLHVIENLQVIPGIENVSKGNKYGD